jgi:hypothetical protein
VRDQLAEARLMQIEALRQADRWHREVRALRSGGERQPGVADQVTVYPEPFPALPPAPAAAVPWQNPVHHLPPIRLRRFETTEHCSYVSLNTLDRRGARRKLRGFNPSSNQWC